MRGLLLAVLASVVLALSALPAAAQTAPCDVEPMTCTAVAGMSAAAGLGLLTRSVICPVLYTHEVVSQPALRAFLTAIQRAGYQPTSLASVDAAMTGATDTPKGCLVLTFDDGLFGQFVNALPVLSDFGLPGVFFVLPGFDDGVHRYMGPAELQALANAGEEVEVHTCNHPNLPNLARRNLNAFFAELQDCKGQLENIVGEPVNYIAYPFGAVDASVLDAVSRFGYRMAFTTRASAVLSADRPFLLPRIRYDLSESPSVILRRIHVAGG
jgi:peptidoglycan/xylan/chitin deacetylase (PgdA/CDA1 family)